MKILIDNGHGENTPGKRSPDGKFREYRYAREIAISVETELLKLGYDAERIVKEESDINLSTRVMRVNNICSRIGPKNCLLVSIHCNAAGNGGWMNAQGWSCYTSKGNTEADKLAEFFYEVAEVNFRGRKIRKDLSDGDSDWEENFFILQKTKCPAVLTENFFQDNKDDVAYLLSPEGRKAVIATHIEAITNYIKTKKYE